MEKINIFFVKSVSALERSGSFGFLVLGCVSAKNKSAICGLTEIIFKKCGLRKNTKNRVGNECRLTRCLIEIWSVCCPTVKMVCPCVNVQFLVVCLWLLCRFTLAGNGFLAMRRLNGV